MPNIFDEQKKQELRIAMLTIGFQLIKAHGLKATKISEITQAVNISKGTFYNFFETKEAFVVEIIAYKRSQMKNKLQEFSAAHPTMGREELRQFALFIKQQDYNLFPYLTLRETEDIARKYPEFVASEKKLQQTFEELKGWLAPTNPNCDWQLITNYMRIIASIQSCQHEFIQPTLTRNISGVFGLVLDELYGPT